MSNPQLMHSVEDGYITGNIERNRQQCGHCGHPTICIRIHKLNLPKSITPSNTLIVFEPDPVPSKRKGLVAFRAIRYIGIGCGCYAKFQRQITHITHNPWQITHSTHNPSNPSNPSRRQS